MIIFWTAHLKEGIFARDDPEHVDRRYITTTTIGGIWRLWPPAHVIGQTVQRISLRNVPCVMALDSLHLLCVVNQK